jgi:hypothetical protein
LSRTRSIDEKINKGKRRKKAREAEREREREREGGAYIQKIAVCVFVCLYLSKLEWVSDGVARCSKTELRPGS